MILELLPLPPAEPEPQAPVFEPPPPREPIAIGHLLFDRADARGSTRSLKYLEGLRGLAALMVVLDHCFRFTLVIAPLTGWQAILRDGLGWILQGRLCVDLFIVLSGYLLMRPAVATGKLPGGIAPYFRRRAKRILPPYYAALAITMILLLAIPALSNPVAVEWGDALPAWGAGNIAAHLFMLHNLNFHWASKIDPSMWTVATEWQIYFLLPLLLLPIWRKLGNFGVMVCATLIGVGGYLAIQHGKSAAPWYLALFAFGMAASVVATRDLSNRSKRRYIFWTISLGLIYAIVTAECAFGQLRFITTRGLEGIWPYYWAFDLVAGAAAACLLVSLAIAARNPQNKLIRLLSRPSINFLGVISYSLYLIHDPLLAIMKVGLRSAQINIWNEFIAMVLVGVPLLILITVPFHWLFERPFMNRVKSSHG